MNTLPYCLVSILALSACAVQAQSVGRGPTGQLVYPAKGQTVERSERDRFECHEWARQQSGFDPSAMPPAPPAAQSGHSGSAAGSMAAGAAGGAAIAVIADKDAGKGAAAGALGMGLRHQHLQQQQLSAQRQRAQQQQAAQAQLRGTYDRGFAACMEARGYVVK